MFILKHLKTLQHVSIIIQIIFRELVCSFFKSLILKFVKNVKSQCGSITFGVCACVLCGEVCCSTANLSTQRARTHTKCYAAASPH